MKLTHRWTVAALLVLTAAISFSLGTLYGESNDYQRIDVKLGIPKAPMPAISFGPKIGPDADLENIEITADSALWFQNPSAATWLLQAQTERMQAVLARQSGDMASARSHEANAKENVGLARAALAKAK